MGTSRGGGDQWSSDFDLTLRQLRLDDLVEDGQSDAGVLVHLLVQQVISCRIVWNEKLVSNLADSRVMDLLSAYPVRNVDQRASGHVVQENMRFLLQPLLHKGTPHSAH